MNSGLAVCYLYSPAIAWQSFFTVALWLVCAGREMQRESLAAGGQRVPGRSASNQSPSSPEPAGRSPSLEYSQYPCTCCTSRKYLHPSNSRERRRQVCVSQINVTTNPAALFEKSTILSFHFLTTASGLAQ